MIYPTVKTINDHSANGHSATSYENELSRCNGWGILMIQRLIFFWKNDYTTITPHGVRSTPGAELDDFSDSAIFHSLNWRYSFFVT